MAAVKDDLHDIGLILRICTAVAQLDRIESHQLFKPVCLKIYGHGGSKDHAVIFHMLCHPRILGKLIVDQIRKALQWLMIMKKRIHHDDQHCCQYTAQNKDAKQSCHCFPKG